MDLMIESSQFYPLSHKIQMKEIDPANKTSYYNSNNFLQNTNQQLLYGTMNLKKIATCDVCLYMIMNGYF